MSWSWSLQGQSSNSAGRVRFSGLTSFEVPNSRCSVVAIGWCDDWLYNNGGVSSDSNWWSSMIGALLFGALQFTFYGLNSATLCLFFDPLPPKNESITRPVIHGCKRELTDLPEAWSTSLAWEFLATCCLLLKRRLDCGCSGGFENSQPWGPAQSEARLKSLVQDAWTTTCIWPSAVIRGSELTKPSSLWKAWSTKLKLRTTHAHTYVVDCKCDNDYA